MTLYKYVNAERIDVVRNLEIRFTQPDALNDPFELQPHFDTLIAEADVLAKMSESPMDLRPMVTQAYEMLPQLRAMPLDFALHAIERLMATEDARKATADGLRLLLNSMLDGAAPICEAIYRAFSTNVGILSLSEVADNELMWAHYADSHRGLVLCFNEQHSFFNQRRSENDEFYFARKVNYVDGPPQPLSTIDGDALLCTKGVNWTYEKEWRMLVPLTDRTPSITVGGDIVHLFKFPPDALQGIILGANATLDTKILITELLDRPELRDLSLKHAILNLDAHTVEII